MKNYNFLILVIQVLVTRVPFLKSAESLETEFEEVDYTDEEIIDITLPKYRIEYATSPEEGERMLKKMYGKVQGRLLFEDFPQDNSETGKKERQKQIRYLHKNQDNKWEEIELSTIGNSSWNRTGKLKVLIHGLTSDTYKKPKQLIMEQYMFQLGDAYIQAQNANVLIVDWTSLSKEPLYRYYEAVASTRYAGEAVATFLIELMNRKFISSWKDIHLIGHSLGSHVSGVAGYEIQKQTQSKVGRISGLDPAGPMFDNNGILPSDTSGVLDKADSDFVDIIHTNMGNIITTRGGALGSTVAAGNVDIFPNGGERQERCRLYKDQQFVVCSHQISVRYFVESINNSVLACPCDSWLNYTSGACNCTCTAETGGTFLGDGCSESASGKYYLKLN